MAGAAIKDENHQKAWLEDQFWPLPQPYDVIFYLSRGFKSRINIAMQQVVDGDARRSGQKYSHCALVGSKLTAIEAYPRLIKGHYTGLTHPGGVRFMPVIDLCYNSGRRYRDFLVLRAPGLSAAQAGFGAESMRMARRYIKAKYGLRRYIGLGRHERRPHRERLSCSDLVLKILADCGRFGLRFTECGTPSGLVTQLRALGWQDVTGDYAAQCFGRNQNLKCRD